MSIVTSTLGEDEQLVPVHQWHLTRRKDRAGADNVRDSAKPTAEAGELTGLSRIVERESVKKRRRDKRFRVIGPGDV